MLNDIKALQEEINSFSITDEEQLEAFRLEFLSRNGKVQSMFKNMGKVPKEERAEVGKAMNQVKVLAESKFEEAKAALEQDESKDLSAKDDITLTPPSYPLGSLHPLTQTLEEMKSIFYRLGFTIADGPEIEDDFHNFTALNFPPNHPARDEQDTFFIKKSDDPDVQDLVLRTHTSPVQIRLMENTEPPIRAIMPGRVYRNEAVSPKSYFLFHQVEALYIDENVSVADLKETLITFAKLMFGTDVKYRLRPGFFPFTEPSLEMDIWWGSEQDGKWLEILGSGMVDPNVFKHAGVDPEKYTGFAWGMGVERIAILRHGIDDIRTFYENDIRFLEQFN
ncbi:MAG: phenylalanine--tRNA ligase subunit alpha [Gracilimonas sp.]|uniref:phenylalanine--tRNA ligase subunit alpha n=1 Tax=Gracilimonas TaxID=649462 RepID=UPI001B05429E|nr:phenylalanine--tRNA ligase subunit alpha [Gracilimonas sp.]MBO6586628.1 phenylalanine--tRNA ligase subunit alpha [Gracilimonas sp.]MBO6615285.1 phenylalanine--tRNA ligase subunit alpha [Gracilimonas sp.]